MRTPNPRMPEKGKRAAPGLPSRGRRREPADRSYPTLRAPEPRYSCACGLPGLLEAVGKHAIGHHDDAAQQAVGAAGRFPGAEVGQAYRVGRMVAQCGLRIR